MKYIESEVVISAMILGMYNNGQMIISEDEAVKFDADYIAGIKEMYFQDEPVISDHISRTTLINFAETYPMNLGFSRLTSEFYIKWKPEDEELAFRTLLLNILDNWCKKVSI